MYNTLLAIYVHKANMTAIMLDRSENALRIFLSSSIVDRLAFSAI